MLNAPVFYVSLHTIWERKDSPDQSSEISLLLTFWLVVTNLPTSSISINIVNQLRSARIVPEMQEGFFTLQTVNENRII